MNVGWLADKSRSVGGAELTQAEFRARAPEGVTVMDCPPGEVLPGLDRYVIHNCVSYSADDLRVATEKRPAVKYWHDVGPWLTPEKHEVLRAGTTPVCCSPAQAEYMGLGAVLIPPPVDASAFEAAAAAMPAADRAGAVSVGSWRNFGKGAHRAAEWAQLHGVELDFYGGGEWAPRGSVEVPYEAMPALLARYERFVFLPTVLEPFGRLVYEAWSAGCQLETNRLVGALHWIEENPDAVATAADDFWSVVAL